LAFCIVDSSFWRFSCDCCWYIAFGSKLPLPELDPLPDILEPGALELLPDPLPETDDPELLPEELELLPDVDELPPPEVPV
jgi:hypothetical protein